MNRREFLKSAAGFAALVSADALGVADTPDAGTSKHTSLALLTPGPGMDDELFKDMDQDHDIKGNHLRVPDNPEDRRILDSMAHRLISHISAAIPEARKMAGTPKIYIYDDDRCPIQCSEFTVSKDGQHAAMLIAVSTAELPRNGKLTWDEVEADLAHEIGHTLFGMNPRLRKLPQYGPHTRHAHHEMTSRWPLRPDIAETEAGKIKRIRDDFMEELFSDNVGLRLTAKLNAAITCLRKEKKLDGVTTAKEKVDCHPSDKLREQEFIVLGKKLDLTRDASGFVASSWSDQIAMQAQDSRLQH